MNPLLDRLKKASTIKSSDVLATSKFFTKADMIQTTVPAMNVALSGKLDGGFVPGLTLMCGPSKHCKTIFTLLLVKAYMDKYQDAVVVFWDSEFGAPQDYFAAFGIDTSRVLHSPITNVEELKFDIMQQLDGINRGDRVIFVVDSIGNLASKREFENAMKGNSAADMSRAAAIKGLFRMVTPHLTIKDIPMIAVNHTYQTQELYSKSVVSGGTGIYYSASTIFIIGRQQEKEGTEVVGYNFIINVEKSRYVREKSKIPISVLFDDGISKWSGLLEMALESGHVIKPSSGWYSRVDKTTGEIEAKKFREKDTNSKDFWLDILLDKTFQTWVEGKYKLSSENIMSDEEIEIELEKV